MNDESRTNLKVEDVSELNLSFDESVLQLMDDPFQSKVDSSKLRTDQNYNGFDSTMGNTWIYPTNYPIRQYQYNISRASLFKNTLVILPTGLGKTFIASVVMYNIYRWYPKGKIIFMAPTRPLVTQQIHACYQVMGFPKDETIELTGRQSKKIRATAWHNKRVFYCTPQVVWSDLNDGEINFPINDIKLIVVDEAHKARGKYAYTEVVQSIWSRNKLFRVLALSATPGRSIQDVCEVIQNLFISKIEVRRETSIDVAPFIFKKRIKTIVVPLDDRLNKIRLAWLLFERNKFRENTLMNRHPEQSNINSDFSVCISIYHTIELLERHGLRVFLNYFSDENSDINAEEKSNFVMRDPNIKQFIHEIRSDSGIPPIDLADMSFQANASNLDLESTIDYGHPKFEILQNCLLEHFQESSDTKAIIFCEYRETVFLINHMLQRNQPLIKPKVFVGQGSSHNRTITQKEQIAIMNDFRMGKCNTLIATCVAEEGIDVGEVDFIICFDVNNKNPIRFIQRIGRTGRKRQGKVAMLVTEGKEQNILRDVLATKDGINQKIGKSNEIKSVLYKNCPRLIPPEFNPQCIETFMEIKNTQESTLPLRKKETKTKNSTKKVNHNTVPEKIGSLKSYFKPIEIDDELEENFDLSSYRSDYNDNSTGNNDSLFKYMDKTNGKNNSYQDETDIPKSNRSYDDVMPLDVKLQKIFSTFIDSKKNRAKWNGFGEKLSRKSVNNEHLPDAVANFITKYIKKSDEHRVYRTNADIFQKNSHDAKQKLFEIMSMLEECRHLGRNKWESPECELTNETEDRDVEFQTNILNDSQMSFVVHTQHQSKYASQLKPYRSTLPEQQIASSTPNKMSNIKQINMVPLHSPIKADQICTSNRRNEKGEKWYLKFLGLDTAYDLFSDCEEDTTDTKNASDEQQEICDNLNKSVCGNLSFVEENEESQYTISRILKICEDAEKARGDKSTTFESTLKRRRLYIGSVDDLFCEDDNFDDDIVISTQTVDVSLFTSDDMLKHDVEDAIEQQKNLQTSTSLFKDTIEVESSNKSQNIPNKSFTRIKSDELFSSYNESTTNMSKRNPSQLDQSQKIQKTPQKNNSTNIITYYCRSPSVLIKSSSILSTVLENNQNNFNPLSSDQHSKSPMFDTKFGMLNSQLNLNNRLEDLDEIKENIASPFTTCQISTVCQNTNRQLEFQTDSNCDTEFSGDEIFATCLPITPRKKKSNKVKPKRKLKNEFNFIDDEVAVSGDESGDESFIETQSSQLSITEYEEDDPLVDMQAKYLQSIRSPNVGRRFHIPNIVPKITQSIFSQFVAPDQSRYEEDSFVVGSDEDTDDYDEMTTVPSTSNKRKSDEILYSKLKRRRRIIEMSSDSD